MKAMLDVYKRQVLEYLDRRRFKCMGECSINIQCATPHTLDKKRNRNKRSNPKPPGSFAPWFKGRRCLSVIRNLQGVGTDADARRTLPPRFLLRPAQMQSIQITRSAPRRRRNLNLLVQVILSNANPGEYVDGVMHNGITNSLQEVFKCAGRSKRQGCARIGQQCPILGLEPMLPFLQLGDCLLYTSRCV